MPPGREHEARAFYTAILGFTELPKPEHLAKRGGAWFRSGSAEVHLGVEEGFRAAKKAHPALLVDDLALMLARSSAAGVEIMRDQPLHGYERAYVVDPFGNRIELLQPSTLPS